MYLNIDKLVTEDDMHLVAGAGSLAAVQAIRQATERQRDELIRERDRLLDDVTEKSRDAVFALSLRIDTLGFLDQLINAAQRKGTEQ